jgi:vesicle-fusing ATPase
LPGV